MKFLKIKLILILLVYAFKIQAQSMYSNALGKPGDPALIFLHDGPGSNSSGFEITTAGKLAGLGFYVIVYDRRGEGRSKDPNARYTFDECFEDLNVLYAKYKIKKATLLGHGFGGMVGTLFAGKYPKKVKDVVLLAAPVSMQESFRSIIANARNVYFLKGDSANMKNMDMLAKYDTSTYEYSSLCLGHAMANGFYTPRSPSDEAINLYLDYTTNKTLLEFGLKTNREVPKAYFKNEKYTLINLRDSLKSLSSKGIGIYAIYGKEDGLFSEKQVLKIKNLMGTDKVLYWETCAHSVFIDQQKLFLETMEKWLKK